MHKKMNLKITLLLLFAIFVGGYASLSLELIVLRQLSSFVGTTTITVSIVMGTFLAFMSLGYYLGAAENIARASLRRQSVFGFLLIALLTVLSSSYVLMDFYFYALNRSGVTSNVIQTAVYSLVFLSVGPYYFGKITAMLSRYLHRQNPDYTGNIMAVDTVGSVCGSLLTTLVIMPFIGVNWTIVAVVVLTLMTAWLLSNNRVILIPAVFIILILAVLFNHDRILKEGYGIIENNAVATISVRRFPEQNMRLLMVNNTLASKMSEIDGSGWECINFITDNFINTLPTNEIKDILVVGAGGFTVGLKDTHHNYTYVDIDKNLKEISEKYFLKQKLSENKKFVVQDANQFLKESTQKYDLIILDTYSTRQYIPMELVTREYFERAKSNLKDGGIIVLNAVTYSGFHDDFSMNLDNTLRAVFGNNLRSQTIGAFNAWQDKHKNNIMYVYYHKANPNKIYSINKNPSFYDFDDR